MLNTLKKIDRFLCRAFPLPGNKKGQLGILGLFPSMLFLVAAPIHELWGISIFVFAFCWFLMAPYCLLNLVIFFLPVIIILKSENLEKGIDNTIGYVPFTMLCIIAGVGFMLWRGPELEISKNIEKSRKKNIQPADSLNGDKPLD